jgi:organic radical activating enzyme
MRHIQEKVIHNFIAKLRHPLHKRLLKGYILWQRDFRRRKTRLDVELPLFRYAPLSINLDITSACNYRCDFCVDKKIINKKEQFQYTEVKHVIDNLAERGLRSVILIGGGEPVLHPHFCDIVRHIKQRNLQLGIVTNGSKAEKIVSIANLLEKKDWVRLSLDAASDDLFLALHNPSLRVSIEKMMQKFSDVKRINPTVLLGASYVITWDGIKINNRTIPDNTRDIPRVIPLCIKHHFDYISFKPCLIKLAHSEAESLRHCENKFFRETIAKNIGRYIEEAEKMASGNIDLITTINLQALLHGQGRKFRKQPQYCHIQAFRSVVTPGGIFNCPAFRGNAHSYITDKLGFDNSVRAQETIIKNYEHLLHFNAHINCKDIICFYHSVNNWIEALIKTDIDIDLITDRREDNSFI